MFLIVGQNLDKLLKCIHTMFFDGFIIFLSCRIRINAIHNQNLWAKFSRGHFTFPPHMFPLWKKLSNFTIVTVRMVHISEKSERN